MYIHHGVLAREEVSRHVEEESQYVRDHGHEEHELGKLMRPPRSLEIASAIEDGEARNDQPEQVLLHHRRQREDPRIPRHRTARHHCKPRHSIAHAYERLLDLLDPVCVRAQCEVDQREEYDGGEYAPREGRQINPGHVGVKSSGELAGQRGVAIVVAVVVAQCGKRQVGVPETYSILHVAVHCRPERGQMEWSGGGGEGSGAGRGCRDHERSALWGSTSLSG
jgi:hypothetical protein